MFKVDENDLTALTPEIQRAEKSYIIKPYDRIDVRVFTNKGERIIDPNFELQQQNRAATQDQSRIQNGFQVLSDGYVKLPLIDTVKLEGMSLNQAESFLQLRYDEFYKNSYVLVEYLNKRVFILGSNGGQVVPLQEENTSLIEVLAIAGGIDNLGKAFNLRLIRGDLTNPEVFLIDLSSVKGMRSSIVPVKSGDIIYVEPRREVLTESIRDIAFITAFIVNILSTIVLIQRL